MEKKKTCLYIVSVAHGDTLCWCIEQWRNVQLYYDVTSDNVTSDNVHLKQLSLRTSHLMIEIVIRQISD